eukprot:1139547-Pelagomonas_calceolata.AAC.20
MSCPSLQPAQAAFAAALVAAAAGPGALGLLRIAACLDTPGWTDQHLSHGCDLRTRVIRMDSKGVL